MWLALGSLSLRWRAREFSTKLCEGEIKLEVIISRTITPEDAAQCRSKGLLQPWPIGKTRQNAVKGVMTWSYADALLCRLPRGSQILFSKFLLRLVDCR